MASPSNPHPNSDIGRTMKPFVNRAVADYVFIENLAFEAAVGPDAWGRQGKQQLVLVSVKWYNDISGEDDINSTLSYSKISKDIVEAVNNHKKAFASVQAIMDLIVYIVVAKEWGGIALELEIHLPKALLQASGGLKYIRGYILQEPSPDQMPFPKHKLYPYAIVENINAACIIGINPHERETRQQTKIQLTIDEDLSIGASEGIKNHWQGLVKDAFEIAEKSTFLTVEALAASLGDSLLKKWPAQSITVSVSKPFAQAFVGGSGAQVTRYKGTTM